MWTTTNTSLDVWAERDRQSVILYDENDNEIAEFWDDQVTEMYEDGFFQRDLPGRPRLHQSVVDYCNEMGIGAVEKV